MIFLAQDARIIKTYEAEMDEVGRGRLCLHTSGIFFDARGKGIIFDAHFDDMVEFWVKTPDRFCLKVRHGWAKKTFEFKICPEGQLGPLPGLVKIELEFAIAEYRHTLALRVMAAKARSENSKSIHMDLLCRSEALWLECNWHKVMTFVKPQRAAFLNEYITNARTGSPWLNPYELIVKFENLVCSDFENLDGFLKLRYGDMTEQEAKSAVSLFEDLEGLDITAFEIEVEQQARLEYYMKNDCSLFEQVIMVLRNGRFQDTRPSLS